MGSQTVFIDNANEKHNMLLLKHFTEKNQAAVVDIKTRKRKTGELGQSTEESSVCVHCQALKNQTVAVLFGLSLLWEWVFDKFWLILIEFGGKINVICKIGCPIEWGCVVHMKLPPCVFFFFLLSSEGLPAHSVSRF